MEMPLFITLLFGLQCFYWFIGRRASRKIEGNEEYFFAGKKVRFFPLMMTFLATQVGGGLVLGSADEAFQFGWPVLFYPLGASLGLILLGAGLGRRLASFGLSTVAELFEVVYKSPLLRKMASILSMISLFMILVAQIVASKKFLVSLGISQPLLFIVFWAIVILYTARGGMRALISTDIAQASVFTVVLFLSFAFTLPGASDIAFPFIDNISQVSSKLTGWLLMPLLFMVIEQDMGQRCFAGANARIVSKATFWAGVATMAICCVPVFFGCLGKALGLTIPPGSSVLMTVISYITNPWISSLVGCAVLAAIISTASSLINAISSNLFSDFKLNLPLSKVQWITALFSIGAIFFAFFFNNILDILIQSYELSVSCLFVPIFIALFRRKGTFLPALFSILFGVLGFFLFRLISIPFPKEIASIVLSFLGYFIGGWLERKEPLAAH